MQLVTETPYSFLPFDPNPGPESESVTLIVKGTFRAQQDGRAVAVDKNVQRPLAGDEMFMDDLGRSLRYATDLVPLKPRGELTVNAVCHPPRAGAKSCDVLVSVGPIYKRLRVTGERAWPHPDRIKSIDALPIRWERAFGGLSFPQNPLGLGIDSVPGEGGEPAQYLPNVEYSERLVNHPDDRPPPAGFGAVSPSWEPRASRQGTRDQRWATFRAPLAPLDFDLGFYNAAPADQQLPDGAFFHGDEAIALENLHPSVASFRSALPGKRLRMFLVVRQPGGAPPRFGEVDLNLDTVHIDVEKDELVLVWRKAIKLSVQERLTIEAVYLAEEELAEPKALAETHRERYVALRGPAERPANEVLQEDIDKQINEAKRLLEEGNVDPELRARVAKMDDPHEIFKALIEWSEKEIDKLNQLAASFKAP